MAFSLEWSDIFFFDSAIATVFISSLFVNVLYVKQPDFFRKERYILSSAANWTMEWKDVQMAIDVHDEMQFRIIWLKDDDAATSSHFFFFVVDW